MIRRFFPHVSVASAVVTATFAASVGLAGGVALQSVEVQLLEVVPLLIALPAMNTMAGDYAALIASHAGDLYGKKILRRKLSLSLLGSVPLSIAGVIAMSTVLSTFEDFSFDQGFVLQFSLFIGVALSSVVLTVYGLTILLERYLTTRRVNSDDVLIPFGNVLSSVLMLGWFAFGAWFLF